MKTVFLLQHLHSRTDEREDVKVIGIYESKEEALEAIERLKTQPGFSDFPKLIDPMTDDEENGFYVDEFNLGEDHWTEGYTTIQ